MEMRAGRLRKNCVSWNRCFKLGIYFTLFLHEDSQAVTQVTQRGCADPILGDFDTQLSWSGLTADPAVSSMLDYRPPEVQAE